MLIFAGLLEGEALSWYLGAVFCLWKELEEEFTQTWCIYMSSTLAIVEVVKVYQRENETLGFTPPSLKSCTDFSKIPLLRRQ